MSVKYKVAREGKVFGEFELWEIKDWIKGGRLTWADDFWQPGMEKWSKLEVLKDLILKAQRPATPSPSAEIASSTKLVRAGGVIMAAGLITLILALASSPDGSAVRQTVLAQYMTNGILLMILGVIVAKK